MSPICSYLQSEDTQVHRAAARALAALSTDPRNCITMHQCGVVDVRYEYIKVGYMPVQVELYPIIVKA